MSHQRAKVGDKMTGIWYGDRPRRTSGSITSGSPNVIVNGKPSARIGDKGRHRYGSFTITTGRPDIIINGKKVAYKGSKTNNRGGSGIIVTGSPNVSVS
jgi:uncharacterized Zn-binding protein involved in type VI secretion